MSKLIQWQVAHQSLLIKGVLDRDTLTLLWHEKDNIVKNIKSIDVSKLTRVDSAGLSLLIYFCNRYRMTLIGISSQLSTLIELYNLQTVIKKYDN